MGHKKSGNKRKGKGRNVRVALEEQKKPGVLELVCCDEREEHAAVACVAPVVVASVVDEPAVVAPAVEAPPVDELRVVAPSVEAPPVDELAERFFSAPPCSIAPREIWGDELLAKPEKPATMRLAQYAVFAMTVIFVLGIGSYTIYARVIMPTPVGVGLATGGMQTPFADGAREQSGSHLLDATPIGVETAEEAMAEEPTATAIAVDAPAADETLSEPVMGSTETSPLAASEPNPEEPSAEAALAEEPTAVAALAEEPTAVATLAEEPPVPAVEAVEAVKPVKPVKAARAVKATGKRATASQARRTRRGAKGGEPGRADVLRKMAYHYLNTGRHREAERFAAQAVGVDPRSSQGWILLGLARDGLQDREGAINAFRQCSQAEGPYVSECRRLKNGYL